MKQFQFPELLSSDGKNNKCIGYFPNFEYSAVIFNGHNNILFCGENVRLQNAGLVFYGDNSLIFLGGSPKVPIKMRVALHHQSVLFLGKNMDCSDVHFLVGEQKHCFIGDDCVIATGGTFRTGDGHLIYDGVSKQRKNTSKSIYIGDHVWVGQNVTILKGTQVDSGSIIGANSLISNKKLNCNTSYAGNPCRKIQENIFWDFSETIGYNESDTKYSQDFATFIENVRQIRNLPTYTRPSEINQYMYEYKKEESLDFDEVDRQFTVLENAEEKLRYILNELYIPKNKNRFVHR